MTPRAVRVPTHIVFSNSLCFPCPTPVPISITCDYYIHKTDLPNLSSFGKKMEIFVANIAISFTFRIREFTTLPNKIACVCPVFVFWQNFQNFLCFAWQGFFLVIFPVFPVPWVPCMVNLHKVSAVGDKWHPGLMVNLHKVSAVGDKWHPGQHHMTSLITWGHKYNGQHNMISVTIPSNYPSFNYHSAGVHRTGRHVEPHAATLGFD